MLPYPLTHPIIIPYQCTLPTYRYPSNTPCDTSYLSNKPSLSIHPINTLYQCIQWTHPTNQPTLSTHLINPPILSTHLIYPPRQVSIATYSSIGSVLHDHHCQLRLRIRLPPLSWRHDWVSNQAHWSVKHGGILVWRAGVSLSCIHSYVPRSSYPFACPPFHVPIHISPHPLLTFPANLSSPHRWTGFRS